jgi:hypothetical protein
VSAEYTVSKYAINISYYSLIYSVDTLNYSAYALKQKIGSKA